METRKIGSLNVSVVGLGCNNFGSRVDAEATAAIVDAALEAGVNFFDTADVYGKGQSEEFLGRSLRRRRGDALIATKFGLEVDKQKQGAKPEYIRQAVEESLRRLGTDRIDLYQLHKPDPETPIADTLGALGELMHAGKVREIGCSNFSVEQFAKPRRLPATTCISSVCRTSSISSTAIRSATSCRNARAPALLFSPIFPSRADC